ncbi:MAG: cob(I)yrinic acid a,c-diamide adenosyltransferase [Bacteroidota bacterium]
MNPEWKIYTKTGDKGETTLIGGQRVPKYHDRIEAYGTLDELNSFVGLLRDSVEEENLKDKLLMIQNNLFVAESILAKGEGEVTRNLPQLSEADVNFLELEIDRMNESLPVLSNFLLPGGHPIVSYSHVARCVCRRAERIIIRVSESYQVPSLLIQYLNRLSDYFFVLSRKLSQDLQVPEIIWKP